MAGEAVGGAVVRLKRPALITVLAVLHFVGAFLRLLVGLAMTYVGAPAGATQVR